MAVVTSDFLAGVLTNFRALFHRDFQAARGLQGWAILASKVPSSGELNTYEWFGTVPKMEDVTHGQVSVQGLDEYNFSITNSEYQAAIEVRRAALERDQLGLIAPRIGQLAQEAARHPGELIFDLFETPGNAFDGTGFFADSRTIGESANVDNQIAGSGTSIAQFQTDLAAARTQMRKFQDDKGRVMNLIGNVLVVPPDIEQTVYQALNVQQEGGVTVAVVPALASGVLTGKGYSIVVNPQLTDANDWYLLHVGPGQDKPFIWQEEKRPVLESDTNPNTRQAIIDRTFIYSVNGRYAVGVTDPRFAVKTTNS